MPPRKVPRTRTTPTITTTTTTFVTDEQLKALIDQGVADALVARDADRSRNGEDSHDSGTSVRRQAPLARECTYPEFMKCKPLYFKGTKGVIGLTQWFKRMETVFRISNYYMENQIKFSTCTLLGSALMWWNSHELALMCARMFPEESNKIEKYIGGLPDMIHKSVMASKPKTMQDAIEFATKLMDKKIRTFVTMEMEPDIENKTLKEYLRYNSEKENRLWESVKSKGRTTRCGEVDIDNMTFEEYERYELAMSKRKNKVDIDNINIEDWGHCQENGDMLNFPVFSATGLFASVCERAIENMNVNTAKENKEVHLEDIEMDGDHDVDISKTKEALLWSMVEDLYLVFMELKDQSNSVQHTIPLSIHNEVKREFTIPYKMLQRREKRIDIASAHGQVKTTYTVLNELCGCVLWKPSRDFTRSLRILSSLKDLFHTPNATVIPTKDNMEYRLDVARISNLE
ncbi:hypothetical protein Tco_0905198 [Tanacetum coccineum]